MSLWRSPLSGLAPPSRTFPRKVPIRHCSGWGLPCRSCCQDRGGLLPHRFTITMDPRNDAAHHGSLFSVALSLGLPPLGVTQHPSFMESGLSSKLPPRSSSHPRNCGLMLLAQMDQGGSCRDPLEVVPIWGYLCAMRAADLIAPRAFLNFLSVQDMALPRPMTAMQVWALVMADPLPLLAQAFALRDAISARFGVARIGGFGGPPQNAVKVGDYLDFFLIEGLSDQMMTLTARDRHLDVMVCIQTFHQHLNITTSVITHNLFGRIYMLPVAPAHRLILWAMLRRLKRRLALE